MKAFYEVNKTVIIREMEKSFTREKIQIERGQFALREMKLLNRYT